MVRLKSLIIIVFIICSLSVTSNSSVNKLTDIAVYAGAFVYQNPAFDSVALVEFPFSLNRNNFSFLRADSLDTNYYARIFAFVKLLNMNGIIIDSAQTQFTVKATSLEDAKKTDIQLFNKLSLLVKPGIYSAHVIVVDAVGKTKGDFFINKILVEQSSPTNSINLSDISSAFKAEYVGSDSTKINPLNYKNGYNMLCNPISAFADSDNSIFLYGEIYNLEYSNDSRTKYQLIINALDKDKNIYQMFGSRLSKKPGSSAVFVEEIDIAGWKKGVYTIEVIALDLATKAADTAYLPISIVSPKEVILAAQNIASSADPYSSLSLKQKIQLVKYLLSPEEKKTLANLGERGKENFLNAIWGEHDPSPNNFKNEFREEIIYRYLYANKNFSTNEYLNNGWNSDRGRIFMSYGLWEQRDDKEAPRSGNPFVIWYYHSLKGGGLTFIFEDIYGDDAYRLVHSNADGEVYSKKWAEWIITGFMDVIDR